MESELRAAHEGEFGSRIEQDSEPIEYNHMSHQDSSPIFFQQQQPPPTPVQMFQPQSSPRGLFEDEDKMKYIIPIIAFIIGFFMAKTMNPIIIRST